VPPPNRRARIGALGEAAAAEEMERRGCAIRARNFRCRAGEADLVADDGECLVFVEVKTRSRLSHGRPRDAVTPTKQRRLVEAARRYCSDCGIDDRPVRFDVVEVLFIDEVIAAVLVIPDAFTPEADPARIQ
jgi:putative endonuclease